MTTELQITLSPYGVMIKNDINNIVHNSVELSGVAHRICAEAQSMMADDYDVEDIYSYIAEACDSFNDMNMNVVEEEPFTGYTCNNMEVWL